MNQNSPLVFTFLILALSRPGTAPPNIESGLKRNASTAGFEYEDVDEVGDDGDEKKQTGRRKIKIEYIDDKSRRHITFSKRKAGIMKKVICRANLGL
jgi:SRF-type transcription factor (DNA-binding and dimerisation domain)